MPYFTLAAMSFVNMYDIKYSRSNPIHPRFIHRVNNIQSYMCLVAIYQLFIDNLYIHYSVQLNKMIGNQFLPNYLADKCYLL